jgi:transcriptional regulator with XRE-family HTH domain
MFYRQTLGLSQRALATKIGVDPKAIGLSERGRRPLSKKRLKLLESF